VRRSLRRLHTQYLDVVYLHDIEFVAPCVAPRAAGNHLFALGAEAAAYGLASERDFFSDGAGEGEGAGSTGAVSSAGSDERILEAVAELRALQAEGLIKQIGISGPSARLLPRPSLPFPPTLTIPTPSQKAYPYPASSAPRSSS
jgi:D-arabinose 1-dehydrogenase